MATLPDGGEAGTHLRLENLTVRNCYVRSTLGAAGMGVRITFSDAEKGTAIVKNCAITGNQTIKADGAYDYYKGTGLYAFGKNGSQFDVIISDCLFENNFGMGRTPHGAGIALAGGRFTVERCDFIGNLSFGLAQQESSSRGALGGGLHILNATEGTLVKFCNFENNRTGRLSDSWGGALYVDTKPITVENCSFLNNRALYVAGIQLYTNNETNIIHNCLVSGNHSYSWGGGIAVFRESYAVIENCTVADNTSGGSWGGAVMANYDSSGIVGKNLIVVNNKPGNLHGGANLQTSRCCLSAAFAGDGNFVADPLFVNPTEGDYRLQKGSPCRDAGDNSDWMKTAKDRDGNPRLDAASGIVDIGCYEYQTEGAIIFVR